MTRRQASATEHGGFIRLTQSANIDGANAAWKNGVNMLWRWELLEKGFCWVPVHQGLRACTGACGRARVPAGMHGCCGHARVLAAGHARVPAGMHGSCTGVMGGWLHALQHCMHAHGRLV